MASFELAWEAPEFEYREKTVSWYWLSILIAAIVIAFAVWQNNFLFGFFVLIAEMLLIVWGNRKPRTVHFMLTENTLVIDGKKQYQVKDFEAMSVDAAAADWTEIILFTRAKLRTPLKLLFPSDRLEELRAQMKTVLKEIPYEPTVLDAIEKLTRF